MLLDYSLLLFSVPVRELGLLQMAGEVKIRTPSAKKAPGDNKVCKFSERCICVFVGPSVCLSVFQLPFSTPFLFLCSVGFSVRAVTGSASCNVCHLAVGAFSTVAPCSGLCGKKQNIMYRGYCAGRRWCPWPSCKWWWLLKFMTTVREGIYIWREHPPVCIVCGSVSVFGGGRCRWTTHRRFDF